jgi:NADH-ubiquinone oxidoreductase chain 2
LGLSSSIILLGCGLIYSYTGLTNFESIYSIISTSNSITYSALPVLSNNTLSLSYDMGIQGLSIGLILIFIGFLFKIAAAPLHNWSPDKCYGKTLLWEKLSNSGEALKGMIPSYSRKAISG